MKGQAFVGLPSEKSAEKALRDTNGYVLYDKPLVVVSFPSRPAFSPPGTTRGFCASGSFKRVGAPAGAFYRPLEG